MDNHEAVLDALTAFGKNPNPQEIPLILEQYLNCVAKNGETLFSWSQLKPLILRKMELVIMELRRNLASENIPTRPNVENVRFDVIHARIIDSLHKFNGAPFTIQRLCELLLDPKRHYKRSDKFMRGLEKNVLVVSTVDPFGRKVVCDSGNKSMVNGIGEFNGSYPGSGLSVPLPPVPGWVKTTAASASPSRTGSAAAGSLQDCHKTGISLETSSDKDEDIVSNGMTSGLGVSSSVFSDQGGSLAVHSEEIVEETVVTMDTSEVSSVITDGGEAMAESEELDGEDREASFSSSSSSSSEELSTSSENAEPNLRLSAHQIPTSMGEETVTITDENNRPWAAFAQDAVTNMEDFSANKPSDNHQTDNVANENQIIEAASSSSSLSKSPETISSSTLSSLSSSSETLPTVQIASDILSHGGAEKAEAEVLPSTNASWTQNNDSTTSPNLASQENATSDIQESNTAKVLSSQETQAPSTTVTLESSHPSSDLHIPSSSSFSTSGECKRSYAQVVASSSSDIVINTEHDNTIPCDSVAGLERLVGSMEPALPTTSSSPSSTTSSSSPSHVTLIPSCLQQPSLISSSDAPSEPVESNPHSHLPTSSHSLEDEPVCKRPRLSLQEEERIEDDGISTSSESRMEIVENQSEESRDNTADSSNSEQLHPVVEELMHQADGDTGPDSAVDNVAQEIEAETKEEEMGPASSSDTVVKKMDSCQEPLEASSSVVEGTSAGQPVDEVTSAEVVSAGETYQPDNSLLSEEQTTSAGENATSSS